MLPGTTRSEAARAPYPYDHHPSQAGRQTPSYGYQQRTHIELPRPLEPRPTHLLQSSLLEASGNQRSHHDSFRAPSATTTEYRAQGQSLPGLRDILTPGPQGTAHHAYQPSWTPHAGPPALSNHSNEGYYPHHGLHPPMALHSDAGQSYQHPPERRLELPILQTTPVSRRPPQSVPVSPFAGYPEARDYGEARGERPRQTSSASYLTNGVPSPYGSVHDDSQYRSSVMSHDGPPLPPGGAESQRKYLGVKEVPGEGAFHLYEGGFRIPTQVDGEQVNPQWGLTKANKPRKRLALACLDCREKKIKCEPGANSCLQCEKAKRPCRRAQLHPSQTDSAVLPAWQSSTVSPVRKGVSDPTPQGTQEPETEIVNKRRSREDTSPPNVPTKKHRSASPNLTTQLATAEPDSEFTQTSPVAVETSMQGSHRGLAWEEDPYVVDKDTTLHLLDMYFANVNSSTYCLYPRNAFMRWITTSSKKCHLEQMVLYAMLAVGSLFADHRLSSFGRQCAQIAKDAITAKQSIFRLPVVHARLLMALYHTTKGANDVAWDYAGSAIRASTCTLLRLHDEEAWPKEKEDCGQIETIFGLTKHQLVECKRRTFWSCFLMDRYEYGTLCAITLQDIFLRLPCTEHDYEQGLESGAPYFNNGIIDPTRTILTPASPVCPMAWLCLLSAIWGDVLTFLNRMVHRPSNAYQDAYEAFYAETHTRLQGWSSRLPEYLQHNEHNAGRSIQGGYGSTFASIHALHYFILMRLNRYVCHNNVSPDLVKRNIRAAHYHAHAMLRMLSTIQSAAQQFSTTTNGQQVEAFISAPFVGHATMAAIDIVGAGGLDTSLGSTLDAMSAGLGCLRGLSKYWNSAKDQLNASSKRYYQIRNIVARPYKAHGGAWLGREWGMIDSLEKEFKPEHDCIYADEDGRIYFEALKEDQRDIRSPPGSVRIV